MPKRTAFSILFSLCFLFSPAAARADSLELSNGDRVTGELLYEDKQRFIVKTPSMGDVTVKKEFVKRRLRGLAASPQAVPARKPRPKTWTGEFSTGYDRRSGNTSREEIIGRFKVQHKTENREFKARGDAFYSADRGRMTGQRLYGNAYFAPYFGKDARWYNFYKVEGDKDRFARIRFRVTPSSGLGYWFSQGDDWKLLGEFGAGFTHTNFTTEAFEDRTEIVLTPRVFFEKRLLPRIRLSQDLTVYPSLTETGEFRVRSETVFTHELTERISIRFGIIDEYSSDPPPGAESNDFRAITTITYKL